VKAVDEVEQQRYQARDQNQQRSSAHLEVLLKKESRY
jgi:hypothetical protein